MLAFASFFQNKKVDQYLFAGKDSAVHDQIFQKRKNIRTTHNNPLESFQTKSHANPRSQLLKTFSRITGYYDLETLSDDTGRDPRTRILKLSLVETILNISEPVETRRIP